ncbi:DUF262 domain-containing protein [Nodosilinea sp. LEGE 07088]|uniref:DUF262 domain-containing protein n=1 Tax=Nodosilinea sp. LEGE 07088 TaxID=2777968 RepID=UPI00187E95FB|nr:DUF262 domain-containing protein [Nodosilinea sp. LEGE 07088]MBE9140018.1 DUF262 domain-containing protein [Nodosilinea sp. LEGE 07088]
MENRTYYGEYSLWHWIELVLKQNIVLPPYQRYFVWNEKKVNTLIKSFKEKQFVPPVTIGAFKIEDTNKNLILDGQQRITSILLAYLGLYPDEQTYRSTIQRFANDNDEAEEAEEARFDNILEWNVEELTKKGRRKDVILEKVVDGNYKSIDLDIDEEFLKKNFLGFSYLVPQVKDENEQQKYYSSVFRNINIQGEPLLPQQSRASLYFLDQDLVDFFSPEFGKEIKIKVGSSETQADFVRYLSLLSQYYKNKSEAGVARGYKAKMEKFYEEYIYASVNDVRTEAYGKFSDVFPGKEYRGEFEKLRTSLDELDIPKEYTSIIDLDTHLFGLTYQILFEKKTINTSNKDDLKQELDRITQEFKGNDSHRRSPNNLGNLRMRIKQSISIYERYRI